MEERAFGRSVGVWEGAVICYRERLLGPAGERGDGDLGAEFGRGFVRVTEMPTSFGVASCVRVSISTDPRLFCRLQNSARTSSPRELIGPGLFLIQGRGGLLVGDVCYPFRCDWLTRQSLWGEEMRSPRMSGCTYKFKWACFGPSVDPDRSSTARRSSDTSPQAE